MPDGAFDVLGALTQGQHGAFQPPKPVHATPAAPAAPAPQQPQGMDVIQALSLGQRGMFKPPPAPPTTEETPGQVAGDLWGGIRQGFVGMANAPLTLMNTELEGLRAVLGNRPALAPAGQSMPQVRQPTSFAGHVAQSVGQMLPGLPAGALGEGPALAGMAKQALPILGGALGGEVAREVAPESLEGPARTAGTMLGAMGAGYAQEAGAPAAARMATKPLGMMGIGPKTTVGGVEVTAPQIAAAAKQVRGALGPEGTQALMQPQTLPGVQDQIVPGSEPTTAQLVPAAAGLEKAHRTATPEPFVQRAQEQNNARTAQVQKLAPADARPGAVGEFFLRQLQDTDAAGQQAIGAARQGVQNATDTLGGQQPTEAYGEQIRGSLQAAKAPMHAATQRLWDAVDPEGTWALPVGDLRQAAADLASNISPTAQTDAQETALIQRAASLPDVVRFRDLGDMRADINAGLRRLSGAPGYDPNVRRLSILKGAIDQTIAGAMDQRGAQEAQAVASGQMTPEETMMGRLQAQQQDWYAARNAGASQATAGGGYGESAGGYAGRGSAAVPGARGTEGTTGGRSGSPSGSTGLPNQAQPLAPNVTPENVDAYRAAVAATREEKQRFGQGGVGKVLRPGRQGEEWSVQPGAVPGAIFTRGPTEPGEVARYVEAVGGPEQAAQIGRETLANELRQTGIIKPDGTLDANRFATWQARRKPTIDQFPGLGDQFSNAETAQRTLDDVTALHQEALKEFNRSAAANFIHDDPMVAVRKAFASGNPAETFAGLANAVRGNPDAEAGLRRAVVDFLVEKTRSAAPAGETEDFLKPAVFRNWVRQNSAPLKQLFGGQGINNLDAVAADLRRQAQMNAEATTGSNTAQKLLGARKHGVGEKAKDASALGVLMLAGEHLGEAVHGGAAGSLVGAVALPVAGELLHAMRQAGLSTVNDLVREAMLHPQVARELLTRTEGGEIGPVASQRIARALQR